MYNNLENVLIMIVLFILSFGQVLTYLGMYDFFSPFWVLVSGLRVFQGIPDMQIPPITRNSFLGTAMTMCFQSLFNPQTNENAINNSPLPTLCSSYHQPPPGTDYKDNPSVFGNILRGDNPVEHIEKVRNC